MTKLSYLNVGCGSKYNKNWYNIDLQSHSPDVIENNLLKGLPFKDNMFEVVYHSQVIEHIAKENVDFFIKECFRVLKPGGILRIVTPDLEDIAREYIKLLEMNTHEKSDVNRANYEWVLLELLDQTFRNKSGGNMAIFLNSQTDENVQYALDRIGYVGTSIRKEKNKPQSTSSILSRVKFHLSTRQLRIRFLKIVLTKEEFKKFEIGNFRLAGEIHYWLYDKLSLKELLQKNDFKNVIKTTSSSSRIPDWPTFELDEKNGVPYDPKSLFMEATK